MPKTGTTRGKQGPSLPFSISRQLDAQPSATERNERTSKAYALKDRKAQRKARRRQKGQKRRERVQRGREEHANVSKRQRPGQKTAQVNLQLGAQGVMLQCMTTYVAAL